MISRALGDSVLICAGKERVGHVCASKGSAEEKLVAAAGREVAFTKGTLSYWLLSDGGGGGGGGRASLGGGLEPEYRCAPLAEPNRNSILFVNYKLR